MIIAIIVGLVIFIAVGYNAFFAGEANVTTEATVEPYEISDDDTYTMRLEVTNDGTEDLEINSLEITERNLDEDVETTFTLDSDDPSLSPTTVEAGETEVVLEVSEQGDLLTPAGQWETTFTLHTEQGEYSDSVEYVVN